jgi:hypothetical protein
MADRKELNCREASRLLSLACERRLEPAELESLAMHLDECVMCRDFSSRLRFLRDAATRYRRGD